MHRGTITKESVPIISNFIANFQLSKLELVGSVTPLLILIMGAIVQSSLQTLKICNASFSSEVLIAIANVLEKSSLIKLSFLICEFGRECACKRERECKCGLKHYGLGLMMDAIKKSKLETLFLRSISFGAGATATIADCITNSKLIKLSLHYTMYAENKPNTIRNAIKCSSLKEVDVRNVSILNNFGTIISRLDNFDTINNLILHCGFTKLKFDERPFSIQERCTLLNSIQGNHLLEHISFGRIDDNTGCRDQLMTKICDLLKGARFKSFDLDYRSLSSAALKRIMDSIKESSITSLTFNALVSKKDAMMMIHNLQENYHFEKLKLQFFSFKNDTITQMLMLPSIQQSSITKFSVECATVRMDKKMQDERKLILNKVELILRDARNCRNIKSARS